MAGPSYLYKSYMGDVPWNAMMDWLSEDRELFAIVTKAFRSVSARGSARSRLAVQITLSTITVQFQWKLDIWSTQIGHTAKYTCIGKDI